MTSESQPEPPKPVGPAIQFIITGDGTSIHYAHQSAADDGGGPVTTTSAYGSMTDRLTVRADQSAFLARAEDRPLKKSWRAHLRERDMIVALATVVGTIAVVIGTVIAICTWVGWTP